MNQDLDVYVLFGVIHRQAKLITGVVLLVMISALVVGLSIDPKYQATTLLYVDTNQTSLLNNVEHSTHSSIDNTKVSSEVEIIKSDEVIRDLVDKLDLTNDNEFGVLPNTSEKFLLSLGFAPKTQLTGSKGIASVVKNTKEAITVERVGLTYVISVSAMSKSPESSAKLANELSKSYIDKQLKSKVETIQISSAVVQKQLEEIEGKIFSTQEQLSRFILNNFDRISEANNDENLFDLQTKLMDLKQKKLLAVVERSWVLKGLETGIIVTDSSSMKVAALKEFEAQKAQIADLIINGTNGTVSQDEVRVLLASTKDKIELESTAVLDEINQIITNLDRLILELQQQLNVSILQGDVSLPEDISAQLYRLSQETKNSNIQYQTLLAKAQELEAESLLQIADTRIISSAIIPDESVFPNMIMVLIASFLFALTLGLMAGLIYDGSTRMFREPQSS